MATDWDPDDFTEVDPAEVTRLIERAYRTLSAGEVADLIAEGKANALGEQLAPISARLVSDPTIDLARDLERERVARFVARGCQQLSDEGSSSNGRPDRSDNWRSIAG